MIPALIVFAYLAIVLGIGIFAFRKSSGSGEDFFVANRALGQWVFLLSLFGTNMTAFAILGSSGMSYQRGIGVFGLMASSSAIIIPLTLLFIGTRLWGLGKRFGHMTQVQYFRDRWQNSSLGTAIFALTALMLVPYIIIGVMGGGEVMETLSAYQVTSAEGVVTTTSWVSYEAGSALVAAVVMSYVFFGGMRGTAWVNTFQVVLFLGFGAIAVILISAKLGGFTAVMERLSGDPKLAVLLSRERISQPEFFSYLFIPLSAVMFPHMAIMCLTAERVTHFRATVVLYPLCIAAIWLPCVYLGVVAAGLFPGLDAGQANDVIPRLLTQYTEVWVAGLLGAGIMACVMASDSQIMALTTMFTQDIFTHYGGTKRFGDRVQVWTGRAFVIAIAVASWLIAVALHKQEGIFELAIRFAFSGFAALAPVMLAALYWKRSTAAGAWAAVVWVAVAMVAVWWLHEASADLVKALKPGQAVPIFPALGDLLLRGKGGVTVYGFLPVMPMVLGSAVLMVVVSLLTRPPPQATLDRYFPAKDAA
ncbi:sodium:proline symporter [Planctomycetota bacterium]|nr:sodium:proline symporter [Planctomycetota bacterium]